MSYDSLHDELSHLIRVFLTAAHFPIAKPLKYEKKVVDGHG